jgi:hypothetical protein
VLFLAAGSDEEKHAWITALASVCHVRESIDGKVAMPQRMTLHAMLGKKGQDFAEHLGDIVTHDLNHKHIQRRLGDNLTKLSKGTAFGVFSLEICEGTAIHTGGGKKHPPSVCISALLGPCKVHTDVIERCANPKFNAAFELEVRDITADLYISVLVATAPAETTLFGRVSVPLASLLTMQGTVPAEEKWFEILPPSPAARGGDAEHTFESAIAQVPGSGLPRPSTPLGYLRLKYKLELNHSPCWCYLQAPSHSMHWDETFSIIEMQAIFRRLEDLFRVMPAIRALKQIPAALFANVYWYGVCFKMPTWMYAFLPLFALILNVCAAKLFAVKKKIIVWEDQVAHDDHKVVGSDTGSAKGVQTATSLPKIDLNIGAGTLLHLNSFILRNLTLVQAGLGKLAAFLEKSKGLMIWEDPRASLMFFCLLFAAAIPFAVVIEVLERLCTVRAFCWVLGSIVMSTPAFHGRIKKGMGLRVRILRARGLKPMDSDGRSDPFAVLSCGGYELKTDVHHKTLGKRWHASTVGFFADKSLCRTKI